MLCLVLMTGSNVKMLVSSQFLFLCILSIGQSVFHALWCHWEWPPQASLRTFWFYLVSSLPGVNYQLAFLFEWWKFSYFRGDQRVVSFKSRHCGKLRCSRRCLGSCVWWWPGLAGTNDLTLNISRMPCSENRHLSYPLSNSRILGDFVHSHSVSLYHGDLIRWHVLLISDHLHTRR